MNSRLEEAAFEDSAVLGAPDSVAESPWIILKFGGTSAVSYTHLTLPTNA